MLVVSINCCLGFLCCLGCCYICFDSSSQVIGVWCVEWDVKPYYTIPYHEFELADTMYNWLKDNSHVTVMYVRARVTVKWCSYVYMSDADSQARDGIALSTLPPLLCSDGPPLSLPVSMYRHLQPPALCSLYSCRPCINAYVWIFLHHLPTVTLRRPAAVWLACCCSCICHMSNGLVTVYS